MMASWKNWLSFQCQSFRLLPIDLSKENGFFSETSSFVIVIGAIAVFCIYFLSWEIKFSYFGFLHAKRRWNRLKWMDFFTEIFLSLFLDSQVSWLFDLFFWKSLETCYKYVVAKRNINSFLLFKAILRCSKSLKCG